MSEQIVRDFIAAWNARDLDAICTALSPDVRYHNIPMEPLVGRETVRAAVGPLVEGCTAMDWQVHHIAAGADGAVLTERTDRFTLNGKDLSIRVMGVFEIADELITGWRDYFDLAEWQSQL